MKKIVFFDIDGTLLNEKKLLPRETKEAIHLLKKNGIETGIATGRGPFMYPELREELGINTFISYNGQYVVHEDQVIYKNALPPSSLERLKSFASKNNHALTYMGADQMTASTEYEKKIEESLQTLHFEHPPYLPNFPHSHDIFQVLLFCEEGDEKPYREAFDNLHFVRWHKYSMDILPAGGSKAFGIQQVMNTLNIDRANVYAFGDGLNDLEMLEFVGCGVAMGNASDEVKKKADVVTSPVDEGGIVHGLEKVGLL
ncbi:Cof-type HAD-IIB family hydrolase [Bacillaceae bacterium SIJ1]|uniref:Cof-type HAD-IIB family hydrolase n=1 Tax=Litoribacterium kuwaitense TaxID=1398745 RepID=UPI0013E9BC1D|nr:Cof-type HAD-IIB family hydrolase [Litoribacterium kuwaitense]NGP44403.1 Cof-type HAD-IIB family hydrolase [Litoribacterium kuwaitense]